MSERENVFCDAVPSSLELSRWHESVARSLHDLADAINRVTFAQSPNAYACVISEGGCRFQVRVLRRDLHGAIQTSAMDVLDVFAPREGEAVVAGKACAGQQGLVGAIREALAVPARRTLLTHYAVAARVHA